MLWFCEILVGDIFAAWFDRLTMSVVRKIPIPSSYEMATKSLTHHERLVSPLVLELVEG